MIVWRILFVLLLVGAEELAPVEKPGDAAEEPVESPGGAVEEPDGASERAGHDARIAELEATLSRQRQAEQHQLALFDSARERLEFAGAA